MDFGSFMPEGIRMPKYFENGQLGEENRRLKERIQSHALEMQQLGREIFAAMVERTRLDASIRSSKTVAGNLSEVLKTRLNQQNRLAHLLNDKREKQKLLHQRAEATKQRVAETKQKIADNRKRVDTLGDYAMKFHDNLQCVSIEITAIEEDMRRYRAKEGELVKLNVTLANAETELKEINTAIKQSEMELNSLGMQKIKYQEDIDMGMAKLKELDEQLDRKLNDKLNLQKQLDGLSFQTDIKRLDDIDVTLERHNSIMSELQQKHEEAMQTLEVQMREAHQKNDAMLQVINELNNTLAEQHKELDRAKEELEKMSKDDVGFSLEMEKVDCDRNQAEEKIRHYEHLLGLEGKEAKQKDAAEDLAKEQEAVQSKQPHSSSDRVQPGPRCHDGGDNLMASMRTSTPAPSMTVDSNSSFVSNLSTIVDDRTAAEPNDMSFRSQISMPKLPRPRARRATVASSSSQKEAAVSKSIAK